MIEKFLLQNINYIRLSCKILITLVINAALLISLAACAGSGKSNVNSNAEELMITTPTEPLIAELASTASTSTELALNNEQLSDNAEVSISGSYVSISIISDDAVILEEQKAPITTDDTVWSVTQRITREQKIQLEFKGIGKQVYIKGIDNLYEFDKGAESGWIYKVNGQTPSMSCGLYNITEGDRIEWEYQLELE